MKSVSQLDVRWVWLPDNLAAPGATTTVLVGATIGDQVFWAEARPGDAPIVEDEFSGGVFAAVVHLIAPRVVGRIYSSPNSLLESLGELKGCNFAVAAIEAALRAGLAEQSKPPRRGPLRAQLPLLRDVGAILALIEQLSAVGVLEYVVQIGPGLDSDLMRPLRAAAPDAVFHLDAGGRYDHASPSLFLLNDYQIASLIQPLDGDDLVGSAMLQAELRTPISLSRGVRSVAAFDRAVDLGAAGGVQLCPGRIGGAVSAIAAAARAAGWTVSWEAPAGEVARRAFFSSPLPTDVEPVAVPAEWISADDQPGGPPCQGGRLAADALDAQAEALLELAEDPERWIDRRVFPAES